MITSNLDWRQKVGEGASDRGKEVTRGRREFNATYDGNLTSFEGPQPKNKGK
ncbi:hypothetical protein M404DRAFT_1008843 [Pisolithus tinctorius Marx 270]|uniref:Uncharacterized protein n=1 Tax=Pisolithus tinctorius Marx 270 TaxID=870435 RepID=A0A0C3J7D9_PISTI|nr:hypothetical protein M404DRAFT_1008843 [Pisolithus tinctorius Marx 270]